MTAPYVAEWMILVAGFMPYFVVVGAKASRVYDNGSPRDPAALNTDFRRRAYDAHHNCFEAFPLFAAAVLLAALRQADGHAVDLAAWVWLAFRLAFLASYLSGRSTLRTLTWWGATLASLAILLLALLR